MTLPLPLWPCPLPLSPGPGEGGELVRIGLDWMAICIYYHRRGWIKSRSDWGWIHLWVLPPRDATRLAHLELLIPSPRDLGPFLDAWVPSLDTWVPYSGSID